MPSAVPSLPTFILQHHNVLGTSFLALLLLILEKLMEPEFDCPSNQGLGLAYSVTFFGIPTLVLFVLGCKFSGGCCKTPNSCGDLVYTTIQIVYGPMLWFFILLADGRYAECFVRSLSGKEIGSTAKAISQMCGVGVTSLMILLSLWLENCCCGISTFYYRKKYEAKMLCDIEEAVRSKAQTKQKEIVQDYLQSVPDDEFTPQQATWLEKLEDIVHRERNMVEEKFQKNLIISEEERKQAAKQREAKKAREEAEEQAAKERRAEQAAAAEQAREEANRCGAEGSDDIPEVQDNKSHGQ